MPPLSSDEHPARQTFVHPPSPKDLQAGARDADLVAVRDVPASCCSSAHPRSTAPPCLRRRGGRSSPEMGDSLCCHSSKSAAGNLSLCVDLLPLWDLAIGLCILALVLSLLANTTTGAARRGASRTARSHPPDDR